MKNQSTYRTIPCEGCKKPMKADSNIVRITCSKCVAKFNSIPVRNQKVKQVDKKPMEKSDGKRQTLWMSASLRKRAEARYPKESFSGIVAAALVAYLKK